MKSKCKVCGRNSEGEYCFKHKPNTSAKSGNALVKSFEKSREIEKMRDMFMWMWRKKPHFSEISGKKLGNEPLSVFFHHILPKEKYPGAMFDEENIVLVTLEEHDNLERDMYKYDVVNQRRELLKTKYEIQ